MTVATYPPIDAPTVYVQAHASFAQHVLFQFLLENKLQSVLFLPLPYHDEGLPIYICCNIYVS